MENENIMEEYSEEQRKDDFNKIIKARLYILLGVLFILLILLTIILILLFKNLSALEPLENVSTASYIINSYKIGR